MSYNTWPTFAGRGWNIKKRPITRTITETADGGQEFRLSRFQSPLFEFDIEIPYLTQADYATLQHFFAQQGGPFTPFLFYPDNEAATATPFFTGDGVTTQATLLMPDGSPALFANSGATPTVSAIHQTDWQGRVALSNAARTNKATQSGNPTNWANHGQITIAVSGTAPNGQPAYSITPSTVATGHWLTANAPTYTGVAAATLYAKNNGYPRVQISMPSFGGTPKFALFDLSTGQFVTAIPTGATMSAVALANGWYAITASASMNATAANNIFSLLVCPDGSNPNSAGDGVSGFLFGGVEQEFASTAGAYIPTTSAPVTVTDYTQAGNQITFGQVPAVGATEDWDGTYAYLVRFKDDQIEMTQTMSQIYEATTVSLRSVR